MTDLTPWLVLAGLGAFHGINPAMGWLFAVALGLHRDSRSVVAVALIPIAIGHALSITLVALVVATLGLVLNFQLLQLATGAALIGWAVWHWFYGHRHRVRVGMQTGMVGLGLWSFLMATSHGAGLMLVPVLIPLCLAASPAHDLLASGSIEVSLAAIAVHTTAMLIVTGVVAMTVYEWFGLGFLRRGWLNVDLVWMAALVGAGLFVIARAVWW